MKKLIAISCTVAVFSVASFVPAYAGWNPLKTANAEDQQVKNNKVATPIENFKRKDT